MVKKRILTAAIVSAAIAAYLINRTDWSVFYAIAGRVVARYLIISFLLLLLANIIRSYRFRSLCYDSRGLIHWWIMNQTYNMMTSTLPGGSGEAAMVYIFKRLSFLNVTGALRLILLSRVMDLAGMSAMVLIAAYQMKETTPYRSTAISISLAVLTFSVLILIPVAEQVFYRLIQKLLHGRGLRTERIRKEFIRLSDLLEESKKERTHILTMFQTVCITVCAAFSVHYALASLGVNFTWQQSFFCFGIYALFQVVPIQGIAGIGTQAAWWFLSLYASGFTETNAVALGFWLYGIFYVFISAMFFCAAIAWLMLKFIHAPE